MASGLLAEESGEGRAEGHEVETDRQELKLEDYSIVWWACSAGGTWRLLRGRVLWGCLWSQAERRQENSQCDSESSLADTPQACHAGIPLGMTGHSLSWLLCPPPEAASRGDVWGKCGSTSSVSLPWETPGLWLLCSIYCMLFCKYIFCSFPLLVRSPDSTHCLRGTFY